MSEVNFLDMSSEDFANFDFDSMFEESDETPEPIEQQEDLVGEEGEVSLETESEGGESSEFIDQEPELEPEELVAEDSDDSEAEQGTEEPEEQDSIIGTEIDLNGTKVTIQSLEEAKQLLEASGKHYQDAQAYNQSKDLIKALQDNSIDAEKLAFAIDLLNKDPKAINALVKDLDLVDILDDSSVYTPKELPKTDPLQDRMNQVLQSINTSPTYERTVQIVGQQWDAQSLQLFRENPEWIAQLNDHVANGTFDAVNGEIQKRRMMGLIPHGMSDYQVYNMVGESMYAPKQQPIRKPVREDRTQQKRAMSTPRSKPAVTEQSEDILNMSSEEFQRKYGKLLSKYN